MLAFLFVAEYHDGTIYQQTPLDVSLRDPTKSAWFDVVPERVKRFSLVGQRHTIVVDLTDGHFEVDGRVVWVKRPRSVPELIYYHKVQQSMTNNGSNKESRVTYIGWKAGNQKAEMGVGNDVDSTSGHYGGHFVEATGEEA